LAAPTSVSEVLICNMALSHVGEGSIESLDEGTAASNACRLWYSFARRQALELNDWSFARKRLTLATHSDDPPSGVWEYRYQYPSDCVMFRKIQNPVGDAADPVPYEVEIDDDDETRSIITNLDDAIGVYTFDLTQVGLFSTNFITLLSYGIASMVAYTLTGKLSRQEKMQEIHQYLASVASASNANEQSAPPPPEADWVAGR